MDLTSKDEVLRLLRVQSLWVPTRDRGHRRCSVHSESLSFELSDSEYRHWVLSGFSGAPRVGTLRTPTPLDTNRPREDRKVESEVGAEGDSVPRLRLLRAPLSRRPLRSQCGGQHLLPGLHPLPPAPACGERLLLDFGILPEAWHSVSRTLGEPDGCGPEGPRCGWVREPRGGRNAAGLPDPSGSIWPE